LALQLHFAEFRQRFLTLQEITAVIRESYKSHYPFIGYLVELLLMTGARFREIQLAQWFHIEMEES
jgi:integrase